MKQYRNPAGTAAAETPPEPPRATNTEAHEGPVSERQRHVILDALRGLALLGIALANYPEFALWTFLTDEAQAAMPSAGVDRAVRFWQYALVDGKFYTIFSLLFGVGFSIILQRHGVRLFLRRMAVLAVIGFCHLMFLWSGDILLLYAVGGLLLPLLTGLTDKKLATLAALLIVLPVALDVVAELGGIDFAAPFYTAWWTVAGANGIYADNFATWLRDATSYHDVFAFLQQGACERLWEFVSGHRLPKVLGLFALGYLAGKHRLYARLTALPLRRVLTWTVAWGVPASLLYAYSATNGHPYGLALHSLLYAISVIPLAVAYVAALSLLYLRHRDGIVFRWLAAPGRMALSNYIGQTLVGILLFYGIGFGLGTRFGLAQVELMAAGVFMLQIVASHCWLRRFRFGLLEWGWRMLTYGKRFPLLRTSTTEKT